MPRNPHSTARRPVHHYESREAASQALAERLRLAAVAYLQARDGAPATVGEIAAAIDVSPAYLGRVLEAARRTFRTSRVRSDGTTSEVVRVELHPHLMPARAMVLA